MRFRQRCNSTDKSARCRDGELTRYDTESDNSICQHAGIFLLSLLPIE
jgi:hypothetical protein